MSDTYPLGQTLDGRLVTVCYCGGGDPHEWRPHGGGMRILACPSEPTRKEHTRKADALRRARNGHTETSA